jgi:AraC-like DNA-binding protein
MGCDTDVMRASYEPHGVGTAVQQIVAALLPDGYPDIHSVATMMRLSSRTLQRRLAEEGVTFARVVALARLAAAQRMLDDPGCKIIEVALDLGYSDPAHFARAFMRWTGLAPREFRRRRWTGDRRAPLEDENVLRTGCRAPPSRARAGHRPHAAAAARGRAGANGARRSEHKEDWA